MEKLININNYKMPSVGLGLWKIEPETTAELVFEAIKIGYRHLDSAADYGNEKQVGEGISRAIKSGICKRDELWITSKLWNTYHRPEHVEKACKKSLLDLCIDYFDLYLIHFPISLMYVDFNDRYPPEWFFNPNEKKPTMKIDPVPLSETWYAMEDLVKSNLVREIGVCNYNTGLLHDLMSYSKIKPSVLQIESHPYLTQEALLRTAKNYKISVTAFSPLASLSYVSLNMAKSSETVLDQDDVIKASKRLGVTPAQIVLRWGIQRGTAIIPKTGNIHRLKENLDLYDFKLNNDEMASISALNKNRRFNDPGIFCDSAFNCFYPIYD